MSKFSVMVMQYRILEQKCLATTDEQRQYWMRHFTRFTELAASKGLQ